MIFVVNSFHKGNDGTHVAQVTREPDKTVFRVVFWPDLVRVEKEVNGVFKASENDPDFDSVMGFIAQDFVARFRGINGIT